MSCHLADAFIQSDLQLIRLSRRHTPWSNVGLWALLKDPTDVQILSSPNHQPCGSKSSSLTTTLQAALKDKVREHIWRDFGPFLHAEMFRYTPLQFRSQVLSWDLSLKTEMAIAEYGCCFYLTNLWCILDVIVLTKTQIPSRGIQIFCQDFLVLCWINWAIDLKWCPWTTGHNTSPKHQRPTAMSDSRYEVLLIVCIQFCRQTFQWCVWPKRSVLDFNLTIALSSSSNFNEVWQTQDTWFCLLCSVRAVFLSPFHGVWMCHSLYFFRLDDPKTQPISAILKLWSFGYLWPLTIFLAVCGDNMHLLPFPGKFATTFYTFLLLYLQCKVVCLTVSAYLCTHYLTCNGQLLYHLCLVKWQFFVFSHADGWRDLSCLLPNFYTSLVKQEVMEWHNIVPLDWD